MTNTWREYSRPIIKDVIDKTGTDDQSKLKKALREAYPFGERKHWPYKVWLDEIKVQLGTKKPKPVQHPKEQLRLFE